MKSSLLISKITELQQQVSTFKQTLQQGSPWRQLWHELMTLMEQIGQVLERSETSRSHIALLEAVKPDMERLCQLQQEVRWQKQLNQAVHSIHEFLDAQKIFEATVEQTGQLLNTDWTVLVRYDSEQADWQRLAASGLSPAAMETCLSEFPGLLTLLQPRQSLLVSTANRTQSLFHQRWLKAVPGSWLLVPIYLPQASTQTQAAQTQAAQTQAVPAQIGPAQIGQTQIGPTQIGQTQISPTQIGQTQAVPTQEVPWGLLLLGYRDRLAVWSDTRLEFIQTITQAVEIAIERSLLYQQLQTVNQELQDLALTDSLTRLANRRRFDRHLEGEWQRLTRDQKPLSLILCDIDYFKRYNDRYGHPMGDKCLTDVAQALLRASRRPADLVARYGGEEFAAILPNTDTQGAYNVAHFMRQQLKALAIPHEDSAVSSLITLTMGIATLVPSRAASPQDLLQAADLALYHAKQQGRDRIYVHALYTYPPTPAVAEM